MKRRVLVFSLAYYPVFPSGAEAALKEITDRIDSKEIEFHLVTLRYSKTLPAVEQLGNVLVHRIGFAQDTMPTFDDLRKWPLHINKYLYQFLPAWKGYWLHRTYKYDAVWAMMAHSAGVPAAIFNLFAPSVPLVLTLQEGDPPERIERVMKPLWPLFTRAFTKASVVQAISSFLADWARRRGCTGPVKLIHNGANPKDLHEGVSEAEVLALQKRLGKKPGDVFLVNTARVVHQKGFDTVIRALPLLPGHIRFVIVGDGPEEPMLKTVARELGVEDRVIFVGRVDRSEVTAYRKAADIFVGPSRSEGLGNAFLSAMASRIPVIATQEGGIADFLFDATRNSEQPATGWAVDKDQPEQIAAAVTWILAHPEEVRETTERARAMVLESYDWDRIAEAMRTEVFAPLWKETPHA